MMKWATIPAIALVVVGIYISAWEISFGGRDPKWSLIKAGMTRREVYEKFAWEFHAASAQNMFLAEEIDIERNHSKYQGKSRWELKMTFDGGGRKVPADASQEERAQRMSDKLLKVEVRKVQVAEIAWYPFPWIRYIYE